MSSSNKSGKTPAVVLAPETYDALILSATRGKHRQGHSTVRLALEIHGPTHIGEIVEKWYNLKTPNSVKFLKREMKNMGIEITNPNDLQEACDKVVGLMVKMLVVEDDETGSQSKFITDLSNAQPTSQNPIDIWAV